MIMIETNTRTDNERATQTFECVTVRMCEKEANKCIGKFIFLEKYFQQMMWIHFFGSYCWWIFFGRVRKKSRHTISFSHVLHNLNKQPAIMTTNNVLFSAFSESIGICVKAKAAKTLWIDLIPTEIVLRQNLANHENFASFRVDERETR